MDAAVAPRIAEAGVEKSVTRMMISQQDSIAPEEMAETEQISPIVAMFRKRRSQGLRTLEAIMIKSNVMQTLLTVMLLVTLFLPDTWILIDPPNSADVALNVVRVALLNPAHVWVRRQQDVRPHAQVRALMVSCPRAALFPAQILIFSFVAFTLEMTVLFIIKPDYRKSFFFAMDVLGTLSILLDVTMIARAAIEVTQNSGVTDGAVLRAARLAKIGAKSGRLAKLVRIFRVLFNKEISEEVMCPLTSSSSASLVLISRAVWGYRRVT